MPLAQQKQDRGYIDESRKVRNSARFTRSARAVRWLGYAERSLRSRVRSWVYASNYQPKEKKKEVRHTDERQQFTKRTKLPKIPEVPSILKHNKKKLVSFGPSDLGRFLLPKFVSFGPIHHSQIQHKEEAEAFKHYWAEEFVKESGQDVECIKEKFMKNINKLAGYYVINEGLTDKDERLTEEDARLAVMFLIDGCALLYYIDCTVQNKFADLKIKRHQAAFVEHDIFLLENQLPFEVLELLIASNLGFWMEKIMLFFRRVTSLHPPKEVDWRDNKPAHLLEFLRRCLLCNKQEGQENNLDGDLESNQRKQEEKHDDDLHLKYDDTWESFRSVVELKASGIKFKENKTSQGLDDIFYTQSLWSLTLNIPSITIDDSSGPLLMNLIAYEICSDNNCDMEIISYVCFLDTLIDHPEDVKELRKASILRNLLGSDEEVSQFFNTIGTDLVPNDLLHYGVRRAIQRHYSSGWKIKWAEFCHTYFSSPWSVITFIAALFIFALTMVQTYFTVWPLKKE